MKPSVISTGPISSSIISRFGASHGSVFRFTNWYHRVDAACPRLTEPRLAPKRLICSWTVDVSRLGASPGSTFDLSVKNAGGELCRVSSAVLALATVPSGGEEVVHRSPQEIMDEIAAVDGESASAVLALATVIAVRLPDGTGASAQTANAEVLTTIRGLL